MQRNADFEFKTKEEQEKEQALLTHQRMTLAVSYFESINLTAIYSMFIGHFLQKFLEEMGKYIMFPIAAAGALIQAALAWREVYLSKGKSSRTIVRAIVETVVAAGITIAVIGALVASAVFGAVVPILFTASTAGKTLYHAGSTAYYAVKANTTNNPDQIKKFKRLAQDNGIATAAGCLSLVAVVGVFLLGKVVLTAIGIATGLFGAGFALYLGIKSYNQSKKPPVVEPVNPLIDDMEPVFNPNPAAIFSPEKDISNSLSNSASQVSQPNTPQHDQMPDITDINININININSNHDQPLPLYDKSNDSSSVKVFQSLATSQSDKEDKTKAGTLFSNLKNKEDLPPKTPISNSSYSPIKNLNYLSNSLPARTIPKNRELENTPHVSPSFSFNN